MTRVALALIALLLVCGSAVARFAAPVTAGQGQGATVEESFDGFAMGGHLDLETAVGRLETADRNLRIRAESKTDPTDDLVLQLATARGAKGPLEVQWVLPKQAQGGEILVIDARRAARRKGMRCELVLAASGVIAGTIDLTDRLRADAFDRIQVPLPPATLTATFRIQGRPGSGIDIGRLAIEPARPMRVLGVSARPLRFPVVGGRPTPVVEVSIETEGALEPVPLQGLELVAAIPGHLIAKITIPGLGEVSPDATSTEGAIAVAGEALLSPGSNRFEVLLETAVLEKAPRPGAALSLGLSATLGGERRELPLEGTMPRTAATLVPASWLAGDEVTASVLHGMPVSREVGPLPIVAVEATGAKGTRIGVFLALGPDATGGGSSSKEVLTVSGSAPVILVERGTSRVRLYFQEPGGEALACRLSEDRGETWSEAPAPVVEEIPQGTTVRLQAGRAVTVSTGGWVIPALHELADGAVAPGLIVSRNRGGSWRLSPHVPRAMSTVTLVELGDGAVLADCGLQGRGKRYLASTLTLGAEWTDSLSERRTLLPCAGTSAALLHVARDLYGVADWRLLFLNPAATGRRPRAMTLQGSNDNGDNWHSDRALVLDEGVGCDHPGLAMAGKETALVTYLSSTGLPVAQWIELEAVVGEPMSLFDVFGGDRPFGR